MLTARDIMSPGVVQLERGVSVEDASAMMATHGVGCLIVTAGSYPVGIMTETDIVRMISRKQNPAQTTIESLMSSPLFSTAPESDVIQIANTMTINRIKKMPVIERQRVIGIITQTDIVRYALRTISELQQQFSHGHIGAAEFSKRSQEIFVSVPQIPNAQKQWHVRCRSCGYRLLSDESEDGSFVVKACPRCNGPIDYDPTPPL